MPDEYNNFGGSLVLDFRKWWRHVQPKNRIPRYRKDENKQKWENNSLPATGQRSFYYRIVSIWNAISPTLKLSQCVSSFKRNLKLDLLKKFLS